MLRYILKRLLLIPPTLFGIILINFVIVQFAPGGPVEQIIAQVTIGQVSSTQRISGGGDTGMSSEAIQASGSSHNLSSYGLDPDLVDHLNEEF